MAATIRINPIGSFRAGSARARWYARLLEYDNKPLQDFIASVEADPPSTPESGKLSGQLEPVSGWIRYFKEQGILVEADETKATTLSMPGIADQFVISRIDILKALQDIDSGIEHNFAEATGYELRANGRTYWPKAVFGVALTNVLKREIYPHDFSGGEGSKCFRVLRELGFEIGPKAVRPGQQDWTEYEVRELVTDYFEMWQLEQQGLPYNKSGHRRKLIAKGVKRSDGSIEFKRENVSAVLLEEDLPFIPGYKPASNYQELLGDIVREYISIHFGALKNTLTAASISVTPPEPGAVDFGNLLVIPPKVEPRSSRRRVTRLARKFDFAAAEERNRLLGRSGEEIAFMYEQWKFRKEGRDKLAERVRWISDQDGDGLGYDIQSFDDEENETYIEVKTTRSGKEMPFFISANEVRVSEEKGPQYRIYRVFDYPNNPRLFVIPGPVGLSFDLTPRLFEAQIKSGEAPA